MAFYKLNNQEVEIVETCITGLDLDLHYAQKDTYTYPVQGWYWFDTIQEAYAFFGLVYTESTEL
jgi:hypothetical protein